MQALNCVFWKCLNGQLVRTVLYIAWYLLSLRTICIGLDLSMVARSSLWYVTLTSCVVPAESTSSALSCHYTCVQQASLDGYILEPLPSDAHSFTALKLSQIIITVRCCRRSFRVGRSAQLRNTAIWFFITRTIFRVTEFPFWFHTPAHLTETMHVLA